MANRNRMPAPPWVVMAIILLALAWAAPAWGVTIRHDVPDASYTALAAEAKYAAVGELIVSTPGGGVRGSGTLIGSRWVLTAAHVVDDALSVTFNTSDGGSISASAWIIHENWTGSLSAGWDIALVELSIDIFDVTPATLYTGGDEIGYVSTMVGYGKTGTGITGDTLASGTRRAGQNIIDGFGGGIVGSLNLSGWSSNILFSDFDSPLDPGESLMGSSTPLALEGSIAPGDSGGGTFIDIGPTTYLTGVHSFGASIDGATNADYGDIFGSIRVSQFIDWISANASGFSTGLNSPEPVMLGPMALVAALLALTGRRSRRG